jgi:hypothetical protein
MMHVLPGARLVLYGESVTGVRLARWVTLGTLVVGGTAAVPARRAAAAVGEVGVSVGGDFNAGADTLATLQFSDGSSQDIKAGNGLLLAVGGGAIFFEGQPHRLETVLDVGVKYSTMQPSGNANLSFVRIPVELLAFYRNDDAHFRVGLGAAWYPYSSLSGSGAASNLQFDFNPGLAGIVQADFLWGGGFLGVRYTHLDYSVSGSSATVAAHSIGVTVGFYYQLMKPHP